MLGHRINTSPKKVPNVHLHVPRGPSPPFRAARSLGGRHRYVHSHRPAPWNLTFDCRESRGGYGMDYGLVGFDQGVRTNPFPVRLRQPLSRGPGLRSSAHT